MPPVLPHLHLFLFYFIGQFLIWLTSFPSSILFPNLIIIFIDFTFLFMFSSSFLLLAVYLNFNFGGDFVSALLVLCIMPQLSVNKTFCLIHLSSRSYCIFVLGVNTFGFNSWWCVPAHPWDIPVIFMNFCLVVMRTVSVPKQNPVELDE